MQSVKCQRVCAGVGGKPCSKRMSSLQKDPHLQYPTCRGKSCSRQDTCATYASWNEVQWTLYESRRIYKKKPTQKISGQSVLVLWEGGGLV